MRFGRIALLAFIGVVALLLLAWALKSTWERQAAPVDGNRLVAAMKGFCRDQVAAGQPLPEFVTLGELVNLRYLRPDEVQGLKGIDLRFFTRVDPQDPKAVIARARLADGTEMLVLGDGSVQQAAK